MTGPRIAEPRAARPGTTGPHISPAAGFGIAVPALSRGTANRSEDLRQPDRLAALWPVSRVVIMDHAGRVELNPDGASGAPGLRSYPGQTIAQAPPTDAVLLGSVDGVDHWAIRGDVTNGAGLRELGPVLSDTDAGLLTTATALLTWQDAAGFCPRCGEPMLSSPAGWSRVCGQGHEDFPRTDPAVIVLVHDGADAMVLARQPIWPPGRMSVLAGFVEAGESLEGTVVREVHEEIGVLVRDVSYLGSQPWPFPRSLMVGFAARADSLAPLLPREGEIESAQWVDRATIRELLSNPDDGWSGGEVTGDDVAMMLPGRVSIAHRMIQGWAESG
jgi:NAD+ diphosphatase